jgi:CheY-like chemotaxis protein
MKLLVVEDQEHVLRLERMVLITDGLEVETASGGREALEKLKSMRYDGIVLDIVMPDIDGWEVLRQLKSDALNRRTPVILVTASLEPGIRQRAFEAGAAAFLNKPFTAEGFRSAIRTAIGSLPDAAGPMRPPPAAATPPPIRPTPTPTPPSIRPTPTPTKRPGVGRAKAREVVLRSETGGIYACTPHPLGGWSCGRCELGLIMTAQGDVPAVGSRCSICQAEVVPAGRTGGKRWWPF